MDAVGIGAEVLGAVMLLLALRGKWKAIDREYERETGWHRMWTERIMDEDEAHDD